MLLAAFRRPSRLVRSRIRFAFMICGAIFLIDYFQISFSHTPSRRITPSAVSPNARQPKIFVAAIHRNSEYILRLHWIEALLNLTKHYGTNNIYVSIDESGSQDDTKGALRDLDSKLQDLGVRRSIVLGKTVWEQIEEISKAPESEKEGWIHTSTDKLELRRIPYLAQLRNKVMDKLYDERSAGREYDIILWLNDVIFTTEDIVTLLATRQGQYDAVCSLDFSVPKIYYDTFALRDSSGMKAFPQTWPYFLSSVSRHALMANQPVPVKSCWNGAVALKAEPFYASPPLRFRGVSDSLAKYHLEGSECCFIHTDYQRSESQGVWVNPNVRVGYNQTVYDAVNPPNGRRWPTASEKVNGVWQNRLGRWFGWPRRATEGMRVRSRIRIWEAEKEGNHEAGVNCLINEMQVLFESGWMHV